MAVGETLIDRDAVDGLLDNVNGLVEVENLNQTSQVLFIYLPFLFINYDY